MAACSIDGCGKEAKNSTMCWGHYCSENRYGDPEYASPAQRQLRRFWDNVKKSDGCWEWMGLVLTHHTALPYGRVYFDGKQCLAHRVSWLIHTGENPDEQLVLHHCDNPRCVRPDHLYLGDYTDNAQDRVKRGRSNPLRGENVKTSKLTSLDVMKIRSSNDTCDSLAAEYNVSRSLISLVRTGRVWKHIKGEVHCQP